MSPRPQTVSPKSLNLTPQVAALPGSQRRDILIRSMLFSDDYIRKVNRQMVAAEEGTLDAKNKASTSGKKDKDDKDEQWALNDDQAKVTQLRSPFPPQTLAL